MNITKLLSFCVQSGSSDLHISSGLPPMIRVDGGLKAVDMPALDDKAVTNLLNDIMSARQRKHFEAHLEVDFSFELPNIARFRANVFNQLRGPSGVFRVIPTEILTMEDLQLPRICKKISESHRGLVLVTGPTGSGKSTTLAAMIDHINKTRDEHVLTVEDPIEFIHQSKKCLINQRELHRDTHSFTAALRAALREDPDIILVGELRDLETIRLALTAAETGHLVFGTLHTNSAVKTITRIIDVFPGDEQPMVRTMLSDSLQAVIAQTLVKREGKGRAAAVEIMASNSAIRNLIREDKIAQMYSAIQTGQSEGMQTLDQHLFELVQQGHVSAKTARGVARDKTMFSN